MNDRTMSLSKLLNRQAGIIVAPGAYDPMSAKLVERYGFPCVYMTGNGNAASLLGMPDLGLITLSEMVERVRHICSAVKIPVIVDADTGFGSVLNVRRAVQELEAAGASAIQIEDQMDPKRCGHELGRKVIPAEEMISKIEVAAEARSKDELLIIARTDARTGKGLDEAIHRGNIYAEAGADIIFVESPESTEELRQIPKKVHAPVLVNMVENGRTPYLSAKVLSEMGFKVAIFPASTILGALFGAEKVLEAIRRDGYVRKRDFMIPFSEYHELTGFREAEKFLERYSNSRKAGIKKKIAP